MKYFYNKSFATLLFCILSLFFLEQPSAFTQEGKIELREHVIKICHWGGGGFGDTDINLDSPCQPGRLLGTLSNGTSNIIELPIVAYAVNIPNALDGNENAFPEDYPRPFLKYEYSPGKYKYTDELANWTLIDEFESLDGKIDYFYKAEKLVKIKLPKNADCNFESSTINFAIDLKLATYSLENNSWEDYPINLYGNSDDIFSCDFFDDTKHLCDTDLDPVEIDSSVDICVPCSKEMMEIQVLSNIEIDKNNKIKILSNPFNEILEYQIFSSKESKFNVALLSSDGQVVAKNSISTSLGENNFQFSNTNLNSGIYYLSLIGEGTKFSTKVFCLK